MKSEDISDLNTAIKLQNFYPVLSNLKSNPDKLDRISGMYFYYGKLIVNALEYYDADGGNKDTTFVINNPTELAANKDIPVAQMQGAARSAGWISEIPENYRKVLDGDLIVGNGTGWPIISRLSVGSSAYVAKVRDITNSNFRNGNIPVKALQSFSLSTPLTADLDNKAFNNKLLTHLSRPVYGFIIPNTRTYTAGWL